MLLLGTKNRTKLIILLLMIHASEEGSTVINDRPIIGILAQETGKSFIKMCTGEDKYNSYLPASYVKFMESGGARVAPIMIGKEKSYYRRMINQLNGLFFPGGGADDFYQRGGYAEAGQYLYQLAEEQNARGGYLPVWGTCLGMQLLLFCAAGHRENRSRCSVTNHALPFNFTTDFRNSRMFRSASEQIITIMTTEKVNAHFHNYCITQKNLTKFGLNDDWHVLATNVDPRGQEFVSIVESRQYPFYGIITHPEKNSFEWNPIRNNPHSSNAVKTMNYFANFFVNEARLSKNYFYSQMEEEASLIYNHKPSYTGCTTIFEQIYFF